MGEVYRARDPRLNRDIAIKVLPASFSSDPDRLRRFEQEARSAGALSHPNIVVVHDVGAHDGVPYVVTELLEGETLRQILIGGKLSPRRAAGYALEVARGLTAAHDKGIVHRDLKPENIFITKDDRLKILDFGLAKLVEPESSSGPVTQAPTTAGATEPGVVLGTLDYMSPEQTRGSPADVRSDIFAFGAILYEMLSGRRAFHRDSAAETMSAILREDPPDSGVVPSGLDRIVQHCLEKKPEKRFQSAHDLAFALSAEVVEAGVAAGRLRGRIIFAIAGLAVIALAGVLAVRTWRAQSSGSSSVHGFAEDRKSIAVLPFQNLSPEPENAFFADGMTEDILTQLAKIRDLKVISRTSVMRYKGTQKPVREIAAELGVATVLEGSVRRAGSQVRIVGQLVDARTDEHLWAETYDRDIKDVFAIQSEVAQQIAGALRATLSPAEKRRIGQAPTQDLVAYNDYLKGRDLYYHYRKAENESAIVFFQRAVAQDSGFALAYAGLGDAYGQRVMRFGFPLADLESSLEMSRKAVALDPELAEGHKALSLSYYARGALRESLVEARRAVELNPNQVTAIVYIGLVLRGLGKFDEALPWLIRTTELDPKNPVYPVSLGTAYDALRDKKQAERWLRRSLELQPDFGQGHAYLIQFLLGQHRDAEALRQARNTEMELPNDSWPLLGAGVAELMAGDSGRAEQLLTKVYSSFRGARSSRQTGGPGVETLRAFLLTQAGKRGEANALLEESLTTDRRLAEEGNQDWSVQYDEACVHSLRGEKDEAFHWLDKAVEAGWRGWPLGTRSPLLDPLRSDSRFKTLESRLEVMVNQMRRRAGLN